jgi:ABC-2 type transport system ATP-binding protein
MRAVQESAIDVERVGVRFAQRGWRQPAVDALHGIDLTFGKGLVVGLLGPNGSGKTTLLRVLAGELAPTTGQARVLGRRADDPSLVARVGYQPDAPLPFLHLSVREALGYHQALHGLGGPTARQRREQLVERLRLGPVADRALRTLSTGTAQRLKMALALLRDPEVLLLDEPTAGLDPLGSALVVEMLTELRARGSTVVLASHHLQEVEQVCDRVCLLHGGEVRQVGDLDALLGTGELELTVRGLTAAGRSEVEGCIARAGGEVVGRHQRRRHLFALFRELGEG